MMKWNVYVWNGSLGSWSFLLTTTSRIVFNNSVKPLIADGTELMVITYYPDFTSCVSYYNSPIEKGLPY